MFYACASLFHPALKVVGPIRKKFKCLRNALQYVYPMVNPVLPDVQVIGALISYRRVSIRICFPAINAKFQLLFAALDVV